MIQVRIYQTNKKLIGEHKDRLFENTQAKEEKKESREMKKI